MNTDILDFYLNGDKANVTMEGYTLEQIIAQPDSFWENNHDFIQWVFPLVERSRFNPYAPLLDKETIDILQHNPTFNAKFARVIFRFMQFLEGSEWCTPNNHNLLRISRAIRSCVLLGFPATADAIKLKFSKKVIDTLETYQECLKYWSQYAASEPI